MDRKNRISVLNTLNTNLNVSEKLYARGNWIGTAICKSGKVTGLSRRHHDHCVWFTYGLSHDAATFSPYIVEWLKDGELRIEKDLTVIVV